MTQARSIGRKVSASLLVIHSGANGTQHAGWEAVGAFVQ
jgi:hypothetical protein